MPELTVRPWATPEVVLLCLLPATMKNSEYRYGANDILWQPFSLKFDPAVVEQAFRESSLRWLMFQDFVCHAMGVVFSPVFLYTLSTQNLSTADIILGVFITFMFAPGNVYLYVRHKDFLARWRVWPVLIMRLVIFAGLCSPAFIEVPERNVFSVLRIFLTKSPIHFLFFMAVAHRVEFRFHISLQLIQTLFAVYWIPTFCQTCSADPALTTTFQQMGYGVDSLISYLVLGREPDATVYPCWMITSFALATIGFGLPSLFVLLIELFARRSFAQTRIVNSSGRLKILKTFFREATEVAVFGALSLILGAWFCLSVLRDALFPEHALMQH